MSDPCPRCSLDRHPLSEDPDCCHCVRCDNCEKFFEDLNMSATDEALCDDCFEETP